jgi:hypothetical protein
MDQQQQIPLNHEASAGDTNKQVTSTLPPDVVQCLENARFVSPKLLSIVAKWKSYGEWYGDGISG